MEFEQIENSLLLYPLLEKSIENSESYHVVQKVGGLDIYFVDLLHISCPNDTKYCPNIV